MEKLIENFEKSAQIIGKNKGTISSYANKLIDLRCPEVNSGLIWKGTVPKIYNLSTGVVEESSNGTLIQMDTYTRLLRDRIIFFGHEFNDETCNMAIAQLLFLEMTDSKKDIQIYLNSGGGAVSAGLAFSDCIQYVSPDVATIGFGTCASMGAVLLNCGTKGKRYVLKNCRVMIHQVSGGAQGTSHAMEITLEEMQKIRKTLYEMLAENSGQTYEQIFEKCKNDYWMDAEKAKSEGFIDEVLIKRKQ